MKLDFRKIYDSGGEEEATPQLNQHSRNEKLPEAFQLRGRFAWIDKRQRNFSGKLCLRNTGTRPITCPAFCHHQTGGGSFMIGASREEVVS